MLRILPVAQNKQSAAENEKGGKERAERITKFAALTPAEKQMRKIIIRDFIDTCAKCRSLLNSAYEAEDDLDRQRFLKKAATTERKP